MLMTTLLLVTLGQAVTSARVFSPTTYPVPAESAEFASQCGIAYLGTSFICDPEAMISQTEAQHISAFYISDESSVVKSEKQFISFSHTATCGKSSNYDDPFGVGIALADRVEIDKAGPNCASTKAPQLRLVGRNFAQTLRYLWRPMCGGHPNGEEIDLLLVCVRNFVCPSSGTEFVLKRPALFFSFGDRFRSLVLISDLEESLNRAFNGDLHAVRGSSSHLMNDRRCSEKILKVFRTFDERRPKSPKTEKPLTRPTVNHVIPMWAIVVFVAAVVISVACTLTGNFTNKRSNMFTFKSRDGARRGGRWGVGFAGGLLEHMPSLGQRSSSCPQGQTAIRTRSASLSMTISARKQLRAAAASSQKAQLLHI